MQCYVANCYTCILYLLFYLSLSVISIAITVTTGVVLAMKPEVIAIGDPQDGRWKITLMFDGRNLAYRNLGILRYIRRHSRHVNDVIIDFRPRPAST